METFEDFLTQRWRESLARHRVLSIYDPSGRYRQVATGLTNQHTRVIEVCDDVIGAREQAMDEWRGLATDPSHSRCLVIYLRRRRPLDDEKLREDPFIPFALGGEIFPDGAADEYVALCHQFLPGRAAAIEDLFAQGEPEIAVINGLASGKQEFPALIEQFKTDSGKEILVKFLCANPASLKKLKTAPHWLKEFKFLVESTLGLTLHGDEHDLEIMRAQLWRYVLFSEFAADLPAGLPAALQAVVRAPAKHKTFVFGLCSALRDLSSAQQVYEDFANKVETDLNLQHHTAGIANLGERDTFSFEERSFLKRFAEALKTDDFDTADSIIARRQNSFWIRDASRAAEWKLASCCLNLRVRLGQLAAVIKAKVLRQLSEWIELYTTEFCRADALHREVEQVAQDVSSPSPLDDLLTLARGEYRELADHVTRRFQSAVAKEGWPQSGIARATGVFDNEVKALWKSGLRVAYLWVDAFRYELASVLNSLVSGRHGVRVTPACAQLPTITRIGMAALLPGADMDLKLGVIRGEIVPKVKETVISSVSDRFKLLQELIGQNRTRLLDLDELAGREFVDDLAPVEVLVVKTSDIDIQGENNPAYFIRVLPDVLRKIQTALNRLADSGFNVAIIAADHGFCWFHDANAGSAISKPPGEWIQVKERSLLGSGQGSPDVLVMDAPHVGIRGDVPQYVAVRGLATFTRGVRYFHDGLSLQECIIPVIRVDLRAKTAVIKGTAFELVLTYRGGTSKKVTTLRPSIEISYPESDLFGPAEVRFLLEGFNTKAERIAEVASSPKVDVGTKEIAIGRGKAIKVPIKMQEGFEGAFEIRAINRETGEIYTKLKLSTDYHH